MSKSRSRSISIPQPSSKSKSQSNEQWIEVKCEKGKRRKYIDGKRIEASEKSIMTPNIEVVFNDIPDDDHLMRRKQNTIASSMPQNRLEKKKKRESDKPIRKVTLNMVNVIRDARTKQKLTQSKLAQKCNLPLNVIQGYERIGTVVNVSELNKIRTILGVVVRD